MEESIRKDWDEIRPKNNLEWKWQWFEEFYFLNYTRTKECPHSVYKTRRCVCGSVWVCVGIQTGDLQYNKRDKTSPIAITMENNMSPFARTKKWDKRSPRLQAKTNLCVCVCVSLCRHSNRGPITKGTRHPRLLSQWRTICPRLPGQRNWTKEWSPRFQAKTSLCVGAFVYVCIRLQTRDFNNRGTIVPSWGGVPGFILCTKPMRTSQRWVGKDLDLWSVPGFVGYSTVEFNT